MLSWELLKKQNRIQIQFQKEIWTDTNDHEHLVSWLFIIKTTETEITYNTSAAWFLEIIWQMQKKNIFTLQQIQEIKQQCETKTKMSRNLKKAVLKSSEHWIINNRKLLLHDLIIYVFSSTIIRKKLMKIHHDDSYTNHFEIEKTTDFLWKKYY